MTYTPPAGPEPRRWGDGKLFPSRGPWTVTASGVSVDAGDVRIRQEAGVPAIERAANAQLIAAGPDLLELAREIVGIALQGGPLPEDLRVSIEELEAVVRRLDVTA